MSIPFCIDCKYCDSNSDELHCTQPKVLESDPSNFGRVSSLRIIKCALQRAGEIPGNDYPCGKKGRMFEPRIETDEVI